MKKIFLVIPLLCLIEAAQAQNEVNLNLNTIKTDLRKNAIGFAMQYLKPYSGIEVNYLSSHGFLNITPEITIAEGTADAFSQMIFKVSGFFIAKPPMATVQGVPNPIPDITKTWHVFPLAAGLETSSDFSFVNMLGEAGYVPYYQAVTNTSMGSFARYTQIGFFLQGGYKSRLDITNGADTTNDGGKANESKETIDNGILRAKVMCNIDTKNFFRNQDMGLGLVVKGTYWFDMLHSASYYQLDARLRVYLTRSKFLDFVYQKGSGAPNFNQGDQFGTSLSVSF